MSKVLLATIDYPPQRGGVARYLSAVKKTFPDKVDVLYWEGKAPKYFVLLWEVFIKSKEHDAIWLSHIFPVGSVALLLRIFTRKPYVLFLHGMDFDLARRNIPRKLFAYFIITAADKVVCNSRALAKEVKCFTKENALVVYPVITDDLIQKSDLGKEYFHEDAVQLLTVARLVERKGHEKVLRALVKLPNLHYHIVGDGPERKRLEKMIIDLGLYERVKISTDISDDQLPKVYAEADIFVMPTTKTKQDREGFGIVYLEAALFMLPVIATNHPGVDEAIMDKVTGLLIDNSQEALVAAIDRLSVDPGGRKQMGKAGREFVLSSFTRESQMRKLEVLL